MKPNFRFLAIPGAAAAAAVTLLVAYEGLRAFLGWADQLSPRGLGVFRTLCTIVPVIGVLCLSAWRRRRDARKPPGDDRGAADPGR